MCDLVARTGRHQQRYEDGCRLVAGCIPFKYKDSDGKRTIEILMISSQSGPGLLFPKGGWENDETVEQAAVREAIEEAGVRGNIMITYGSAIKLMNEKTKFRLHSHEVPYGSGSGQQSVTGFPNVDDSNSYWGFLGNYHFKSKTLRDEFSPEGHCRASMFALLVKEELCSWPEQDTRERSWLTISEAKGQCRHSWMQDALVKGFTKWLADNWVLSSEYPDSGDFSPLQ